MTAQKRIFAAVLLTSFMGPFLGSCINIAIPTIAVEFSCPATDLSWLATAFLLGAVALLLPFGRMADILGRCRIYAIGTAAMAAVSFVAAFSPSVSFLIAMRALQGLSLGLVFSSGMALLVAAHPAKQRGRAIGYSAAATYVGLSLGPVIGGLVTQHLDWRLLFVLTSIVILVSSLLVRTIKEDWYGEREGGFDLPGAVFYTAASTLTLYGLSSLAAFPWMRFVLLAGLVFLALFLWQERRASTPLLHLSLFKNTVFAMSNLAAFLNYSATYAIGFLLSLYLQIVRGLDASTAGVLLLLQPLMMAILSPIAGALSDKHEPRLVASFGMALTTAGIFCCSLFDARTPLPLIASACVIIGIGFGFFSPANNNAIMGAVSKKLYGVASSMVSVMRLSGQAVSMAVVTLLLAQATLPAAADWTEELSAAIRLIFSFLTVSCAAGVVASLMRGRRKTAEEDANGYE